MKKNPLLLGLLLSLLCLAPSAWGDQIKAYVSEFAVTGAQNKDELKGTLQTLLMSRLSGDRILSVESPAGAQVTVTGSYVAIGKVFSIDAVAKSGGGSVITRAFAQGESQDELIPAVGKLAQALTEGITRNFAPAAASSAPPLPAVLPQAPPAPAIVKGEVVGAQSDIIRPEQVAKTATSGWVSQRLDGGLIGIAPGRTLENGVRELFIADDHALRLYRQEDKLKLVAEASLKGDEKVLGVDTADLDGDGIPEVYLTIYNGFTLASQVWQVKGSALVRTAENLPYFFRAIALEGKEKKIYAQQMSSDADFYGDVFELVKGGEKYELKNPLKLPRFGYLYNFNMFADGSGKDYFAVLNNDGYLIVYSREGEELWRTSDKFGGSELNFKREDLSNVRTTGDSYRWIFIDQRITVTKGGEVIVPQNAGFFVLGNSRSYSKNSVFSFAWNGSSLDEKWHTKLSQNYLADYFYDETGKELVLLEVVKKEGLIAKGASMVSIKKVE
jgi:hypothetical protein